MLRTRPAAWRRPMVLAVMALVYVSAAALALPLDAEGRRLHKEALVREHGLDSHLVQLLPYMEISPVHVAPAVHPFRQLSPQERWFASHGPAHEEVHHPSFLKVTFRAFDKHFDLELEKDHLALHPAYQEMRVGGTRSARKIAKRVRKDVVNCLYRGRVRSYTGLGANHVAVSTCNGLRGVIFAHDDVFYVDMASKHSAARSPLGHHAGIDHMQFAAHHRPAIELHGEPHMVYRAADLPEASGSCAVHLNGTVGAAHARSSRDVHAQGLRAGQEGAGGETARPRAQDQGETLYVELYFINDFYRYENKLTETEIHSGEMFETVATMYKNDIASGDEFSNPVRPILKAQLTFVDLEAQNDNIPVPESAEFDGSIDVNDYLENVADFKQAGHVVEGSGDDEFDSDLTHLLSGRDFATSTSSSVIGLANVRAVCAPNGEAVGVNQVNHADDVFDASTIAHEMGHNLGMCHDSARDPDICPDLGSLSADDCANRIMSPSSSMITVSTRFSRCSEVDLEDLVARNFDTCLTLPDPLVNYFENSVCGNGFIELDEECDCGRDDCTEQEDNFYDECCDGTTCTLLDPNYECSNMLPCCKECMINTNKKAVCRDFTDENECDLVEKCDGTSAKCPEDKYLGDGRECSDELAASKTSFLEEHWWEVVLVIIAIAALLIAYRCMSATVLWCCGGDDERNKPQGQRVDAEVAGSVRAQFANRQIRLPANWQVRYTASGEPLYYNVITGERYDFRTNNN